MQHNETYSPELQGVRRYIFSATPSSHQRRHPLEQYGLYKETQRPGQTCSCEHCIQMMLLTSLAPAGTEFPGQKVMMSKLAIQSSASRLHLQYMLKHFKSRAIP